MFPQWSASVNYGKCFTHSNAVIHAWKTYLSVVLGVLTWADGSLDNN